MPRACSIVGFTTMSKEVRPDQVMSYLNELFTAFDALVDTYKIYKVGVVLPDHLEKPIFVFYLYQIGCGAPGPGQPAMICSSLSCVRSPALLLHESNTILPNGRK